MIEKGSLGLFVYPYHKKKLMVVLESQAVVGEYNLSFFASKAAQYEALTDIKVLEFPKEE